MRGLIFVVSAVLFTCSDDAFASDAAGVDDIVAVGAGASVAANGAVERRLFMFPWQHPPDPTPSPTPWNLGLIGNAALIEQRRDGCLDIDYARRELVQRPCDPALASQAWIWNETIRSVARPDQCIAVDWAGPEGACPPDDVALTLEDCSTEKKYQRWYFDGHSIYLTECNSTCMDYHGFGYVFWRTRMFVRSCVGSHGSRAGRAPGQFQHLLLHALGPNRSSMSSSLGGKYLLQEATLPNNLRRLIHGGLLPVSGIVLLTGVISVGVMRRQRAAASAAAHIWTRIDDA